MTRQRRFLFCTGGLLLLCCLAHPAAAGESEGWMDYLAGGWNKVTGLFSWGESEDVSPVSQDNLPDYLAGSWEKLTGALTEALNLRDEQETLPDSAWFGDDKSSNGKKINKLLDEALEILVQGRAGEMRNEAAALREALSDLRQEADRLRNQRITAPESSLLPWKKTRAKVDERLADLEQEIKDKEASLVSLNDRLAAALREMGLELDQAQIDVLLSSVTGDDLLRNTVVFANVKSVVEKLEVLAQNDQNDLEISRRYTGMYLVLNDLLIHTQEELVRKIDGEYKPRLAELIREAESLQAEAQKRSRQKGYTEAQQKSFALNAESNAMTARVAQLYVKLLDSQRKGILDNLQGLRRNRDLAENTYRTVRSSGDLRNLIHSGLALFDSIHALSMPQLQPFESEAMRREFEEINKRLRP
ncbi:MAG: hypothetical protein K6E38_00450 [Fretibacterium sp.]|nr:hypothetical protein [Fretibacterium sp.]